MRANEILLTATDTIRDRGLSYGHPADNLQHTAMLLSAYLQTPIHDYQVAGIMVLVKLARTNQSAGYAEETVTSRGVNQTSALENCETSAIGRALANAGYAPKGKRPSREEMTKVVAAKPVKPPVQEVKADDQDYWTTPVNEYNKVVDAPVTLDKAMETVTAIMGTAEAVEAPSCEHGHMQWREGEKNGKAWGGYFCNSAISSAHRCPTKWYTLGSDGKFQPQKARV